MQYFRYFPTVPYTFTVGNSEQVSLITDTTVHVQIKERLRQNITAFYDYIVSDGERPDSVATKVYGSPTYTWIVLIVNVIFSLFDWQLTSEEFNNYIVERYGSVSNAQSTLIYKTTSGVVVDSATYAALPVAKQGVTTTAYDKELADNEAKRRIKVLPIDFVPPLVQDLKRILQQ